MHHSAFLPMSQIPISLPFCCDLCCFSSLNYYLWEDDYPKGISLSLSHFSLPLIPVSPLPIFCQISQLASRITLGCQPNPVSHHAHFNFCPKPHGSSLHLCSSHHHTTAKTWPCRPPYLTAIHMWSPCFCKLPPVHLLPPPLASPPPWFRSHPHLSCKTDEAGFKYFHQSPAH